jgi:hypothetical protein
MRCEQVRDQIEAFVAGTLSGPAAEPISTHAAGCAECAADIAAARSLAPPLAALPRSIQPPRDLWPAIGGRIAPRRRHRALLAAAAALALIAGSSVVTMLLVQRGEPAPAVVTDPAPRTGFEARYVARAQSLGELLERQRDLLAPETIATLERNLAIIDAAIADSRAALAADPSNLDLELLLRAGYEQKVALLERVTQLARES